MVMLMSLLVKTLVTEKGRQVGWQRDVEKKGLRGNNSVTSGL